MASDSADATHTKDETKTSPSPSLSPPPPSPGANATKHLNSTPSSPLSDPPQSPRTSPAPNTAKDTDDKEDRAAVVLELNAELLKACGSMVERGVPSAELEPWTQRLSQNLTWLATYADHKPRSENAPALPVFTIPSPAPNPAIESLYSKLSVLFRKDIDRTLRKAQRAAQDALRSSPSLKRERESSPTSDSKRIDTGPEALGEPKPRASTLSETVPPTSALLAHRIPVLAHLD
ncbi:hypothetical protein BN14_06161 [Rhizoctonia solani AG-1 IB]|uniref:Uncharacterized protein n=1 Tax=Thanatephorus cucumeris (strain AG1-IB / isolate 7/3/14) TaxID=1108050 RepID=M5BWV8_THACB|nr:hypothetical protein BN14_06161 [Rhizoctonia solani AG-1 IB]